MRATSQLKIVQGRFAAICIRHNVMEFQEAGLAAAALFSLKRASPAVARPYVTFDGCGDVARPRGRRAAAPWPIRGCELRSRQVSQQQREGTIEDRREIAIGDRVTQQILHGPQLVVRLARYSALHFVTLGRERLDFWGSWSDRRSNSGNMNLRNR
jgi:hypothetical protein